MDKDDQAVRDEQQRARRLRLLVDVTAQILMEDENLSLCEGIRLIEAARKATLRLFPDKGDTFDLVIRPRLERILDERFDIASLAPTN